MYIMCVWTCVYTEVWRPEVHIEYLPWLFSTLFIKAESLRELTGLVNLATQVAPRLPGCCLPWVPGLQATAMPTWFFRACGDFSLHAYTVCALPIGPSPQPLAVISKKCPRILYSLIQAGFSPQRILSQFPSHHHSSRVHLFLYMYL